MLFEYYHFEDINTVISPTKFDINSTQFQNNLKYPFFKYILQHTVRNTIFLLTNRDYQLASLLITPFVCMHSRVKFRQSGRFTMIDKKVTQGYKCQMCKIPS